jgi:hypothetical protein
MINGLTHNDGILNRVSKYRGKISTGLEPGSEGNDTNHPVALGYFRISKERIETKIGSGKKEFVVKNWVENSEVQRKLEQANTPVGSQTVCKQPRVLKIVSFYKDICDMWDSFLGMFDQTNGLTCRSHGLGTKAKRLYFNDSGVRDWREIDCKHKECPDFIKGSCCERGLLKCFPTLDAVPSLPYRLDTTSINTILAMENGLNDIWYMLRAAHRAKEIELKKDLPFEGFFLREMNLFHKKMKSGGKEIFVTEIQPSKGLIDEIMGPINNMIKNRPLLSQQPGGTMSLLDESAQVLLEEKVDGLTDDLDISDETSIAREFNTPPELIK